MSRRTYQKRVFHMACFAFLTLGLVLVGCLDLDTTSKAGAAQGRRIETFDIVAGSFELITDEEPVIEDFGGATQYTLISDGEVSFNPTIGAEQTINLDPDEIVIERPAAGAVTVIRFR